VSLKKLLDSGGMVAGSKFDGKVKSLGEMSSSAQQRNGYADSSGNWTDRGYDRATSKDYQNLEKSRQARMRTPKRRFENSEATMMSKWSSSTGVRHVDSRATNTA